MTAATPIFGQFKEETPKLPAPLDICNFMSDAPQYPPVVIEGLLRESEIILMGGQAKRWKSWARADMLYCIGNGFKWLNFPTVQGLVIHFDLELLEADLRWRFDQIHQSYCKEGFNGSLANLRYVPLRGKSFTIADLEEHAEQLKKPHYAVASLDPIYRLLATKNESDPTAVGELLNKFLSLGSDIKAAIALLQHFSKGDQSQKDAQDRFSGSSVWARYPDALMTFTDHQDEHCFTCEFTLRSFQPIEPFTVRWQFPRFRIDTALDPEKLKKPGRPKESNAEQLCSVLTFEECIPYADFQRRAIKVLGISSASFERRLREAKASKLIYQNPLEKTYGLTPEYCKKNGK